MRFSWRERVGLPECPYMTRWVADFGPFAVRLHHWHHSDDLRHHHDHAWWFATFVLRGGYDDYSPQGIDRVRAPAVRLRGALHRHSVAVLPQGAWTLLVTGRAARRWGFWVGPKFVGRDKFFAVQGHHPCDQSNPAQLPVRFKPKGGRIPPTAND